jgi:hypothetical protein
MLQRRERYPVKTPFAMDDHAFVVAEVAFAGAESPGAFDDAFFADEVGGLDGVGLVGGAEDHAVSEIEGQRRGTLCGGHNGAACFADDVHAVVIAGAVFAGGHEASTFVGHSGYQYGILSRRSRAAQCTSEHIYAMKP